MNAQGLARRPKARAPYPRECCAGPSGTQGREAALACRINVRHRLAEQRRWRQAFAWTAPLSGSRNADLQRVRTAPYNWRAEIEVPQGGGEGMLWTQDGRIAGNGPATCEGQASQVEPVRPDMGPWAGAGALSPGKHVLEVEGKAAAPQTTERSVPLKLAWDEHLGLGSGTDTPLDQRNTRVPLPFIGKLGTFTLTIDRLNSPLMPADELKLLRVQRDNKSSAQADPARHARNSCAHLNGLLLSPCQARGRMAVTQEEISR